MSLEVIEARPRLVLRITCGAYPAPVDHVCRSNLMNSFLMADQIIPGAKAIHLWTIRYCAFERLGVAKSMFPVEDLAKFPKGASNVLTWLLTDF